MRTKPTAIWLDYGEAGKDRTLLENVSAVTVAGSRLWTASDEGRTLECLVPHQDGFRLERQFKLDKLFEGIPDADLGREADIEALDFCDGALWVSGSHSSTRRPPKGASSEVVEARIRKRPSRRLLGAIKLSKDGSRPQGVGRSLPFRSSGSLRSILGSVPHLAPFMELPSKENGLDLEGLACLSGQLYIGLRGPVVRDIAIIPAFKTTADTLIDAAKLVIHFVDLNGLGVRDLTRWRDGLLIVAGPVSSADGPFQLFHWRPQRTDAIQKPDHLDDFASGPDHPEGICAFRHDNTDGIIVVYDTTSKERRKEAHYRADWFPLP